MAAISTEAVKGEVVPAGAQPPGNRCDQSGGMLMVSDEDSSAPISIPCAPTTGSSREE